MPFKSKAQERYMFMKKKEGKLPGVNLKEWADKTDQKSLPEHVKKHKKEAFTVASEAEIDEFVKAAMDRYAELGIPQNVAQDLFRAKMVKVAGDLGFPLPGDTKETVAVKKAVAMLVDKGMDRKQAEVLVLNFSLETAAIEKRASIKAKIMNLIKNA